MIGGNFFDTNVLLYLYNEMHREKQARARALFREHAAKGDLILSTQVLQEFYSVGSRELGLPRPLLRRAIELLIEQSVVVVGTVHILEATELEERYRISFWDALVCSAANSRGASVLYTEDLNDGQRYGAVTVRNPFAGMNHPIQVEGADRVGTAGLR